MSQPSIHPMLLALLVTLVAAVWDLRTGEIPNWLVGGGATVCLGAAVIAARGAGAMAVLHLLLAMIVGLFLVALVPLLLFRAGGMGGGDVKLLAMIGLALGPLLGVQAELYAFVLAMLYAPMRLIWEGKLGQALRVTGALAVRPLLPRARRPELDLASLTELRFGPAIFFGALLAIAQHVGGLR